MQCACVSVVCVLVCSYVCVCMCVFVWRGAWLCGYMGRLLDGCVGWTSGELFSGCMGELVGGRVFCSVFVRVRVSVLVIRAIECEREYGY